MRSMAATSALASTGSSRAGRAKLSEYGSGSTSTQPSSRDLGVEHVRAAAEVHDVEDVDVLAQLRSEICRRSQTSSARRRTPARPASMRIEASVTRRAKRSGRIAASSRRPLPFSATASSASGGAAGGDGRGELEVRRRGARRAGRRARATSATSSGGPDDPRVLAEPEHPRDELAGVRVRGREDDRRRRRPARPRRSGRSGARPASRCARRPRSRRRRPSSPNCHSARLA